MYSSRQNLTRWSLLELAISPPLSLTAVMSLEWASLTWWSILPGLSWGVSQKVSFLSLPPATRRSVEGSQSNTMTSRRCPSRMLSTSSRWEVASFSLHVLESSEGLHEEKALFTR